MKVVGLSIENFGCFQQPCGVSAEAARKAVVCVHGRGGTGKTAALNAIAFMGWFASESFRRDSGRPLPCVKFMGGSGPSSPTALSMDFEAPAAIADLGAGEGETRTYRYGLRLSGVENGSRGPIQSVEEESLFWDGCGSGKLSRLLLRRGGADPEIQTEGSLTSGRSASGRAAALLKSILRSDASAFSTLAGINDDFGRGIAAEMGKAFPSARFRGEPHAAPRGSVLADLREYADRNPNFAEFLDSEIAEMDDGAEGAEIADFLGSPVIGIRAGGLRDRVMVTQEIMDRGFQPGDVHAGSAALAFIALAPAIHAALSQGGAALLDNADSLGLRGMERVASLFNDPESNPKGAQAWMATSSLAAADELGRTRRSGAGLAMCSRGARGGARIED